MTANEEERIRRFASWYETGHGPVDRALVSQAYRTMRSHFAGPRGLELGPADGIMTTLLAADFPQLTVVDAAADLLERIPALPNVLKVHSQFEDFSPTRPFQTIVAHSVLQLVEDPVAILRRARDWLSKDGLLLIGVSNAKSLHRLAAVEMGLLKRPTSLSPRDREAGVRRVYTPSGVRADLLDAGLKVELMTGIFVKPLSNRQLEQWSPEMLAAFLELGPEIPEHAAEILAVCSVSAGQ